MSVWVIRYITYMDTNICNIRILNMATLICVYVSYMYSIVLYRQNDQVYCTDIINYFTIMIYTYNSGPSVL